MQQWLTQFPKAEALDRLAAVGPPAAFALIVVALALALHSYQARGILIRHLYFTRRKPQYLVALYVASLSPLAALAACSSDPVLAAGGLIASCGTAGYVYVQLWRAAYLSAWRNELKGVFDMDSEEFFPAAGS